MNKRYEREQGIAATYECLMIQFDVKLAFLLYIGRLVSNNPFLGRPAFKNALRTLLFRTAWYSDDHNELGRIYQILKDPWNIQVSQYEQTRLRLLLEEVQRHPHESVLEVGCGEGVFTSLLTTIAQRVVAIDVSDTAVARARERCPTATYVTTSLNDFVPGHAFDLVICAETLYYIQDVRQAIEKLSSLARYCVVSYIGREARRLNGYFEQVPSAQMRKYEIGRGVLKRSVILVVWNNDGRMVPQT